MGTPQLTRIFRNPWWVVFGSTLGMVVSYGPAVVFTFGVFLKPVISEFGWNRGTMSAALIASQTCGAIATPFAGKLIDRWGTRRLTLTFILLFSLTLAAISQTSSKPAVFFLLYALCGLAGAGQSPLAYGKAISAAFETRRGLALGIAMAGVGLGTALMPQLARTLISAFGWRGAYIGVGVVAFVVAFPSVFLFVREPDESARGRAGRRPEEVVPGMNVGEVLKGSFQFWYLMIAAFLVSAVTNGVITHTAPLLTDRGVSMQIATFVLTLYGLAMIAGRVLGGYLVDRFFAPYVAAGFFLLPVAGIVLLGSGGGGVILTLSAVCTGLGLGSEMALMAFLIGRYFGLRAFGEIYGYMMGVFIFGTGLGPWIMGTTFDMTHSYNPALIGFGLVLLLASFLTSRLGPYTHPAGVASPRPNTSAVQA